MVYLFGAVWTLSVFSLYRVAQEFAAIEPGEETLPIHDIRVTFHGYKLGRIHLEPDGLELTPEPASDGIGVTIPRLDIHAMVVAQGDHVCAHKAIGGEAADKEGHGQQPEVP